MESQAAHFNEGLKALAQAVYNEADYARVCF